MPKIVDHEMYRAELLRASFEVVARVGYGTLSMKQLAQHLHVSTGTIYHYFKNKEDWFVSLVTHYTRETFEGLSRDIPLEASPSEKCRCLLAHIEQHIEQYSKMIGVASDFVRMPKTDEHEGALELTVAGDRLTDYLAALLETDEATARALLAYLVGLIVSNSLYPRSAEATEHLPFVLSLMTSGRPEHKGDASA